MATTGPTRGPSARTRPARPALSEAAILDAGLAILKTDGLDAVTMRRVAGALDTGAASLYVYVANRDELYEKMLGRVIDGIPTEPIDPARWREQLMALLKTMLEALEAYPGVARVALASVPRGDGAMRVADTILGLLLAGGIKPKDAAWGLDVIPLFVTATAVETAVHTERDHTEEEWIADLDTTLNQLDAARFPHMAAHAEDMTSGLGDERFTFGIDLMIDGMLARAGR